MVYSLVLLNKPVINSDKNEKMGRIKGYVIEPDEKRVSAFILAPAEGQSSLDVVPFSYVKSVYHNAVIVENMSEPLKMSDVPELLNTFLKDIAVTSAQVLSDTGMLMGTVHDFAIGEKDGAIARLSLIPAKDVEKVAGHHIMKITQERIIVNADALTEKVADDDELEAPVPPPARPAPQPQPSSDTSTATPAHQPESRSHTPPAESDPPRPAAQPASTPPATPAAAPPQEIKLPDVPTKDDIKDVVRELLAEVSDSISGRISELDTSQSLDSLKDEILEAIREQQPPPAAEDEDDTDEEARAMEMLLEEKITRGATAPIDNVKELLVSIESRLSELLEKADELAAAAGQAPEVDLSPIRDIAGSIADKLDEHSESIKKSIEDSRPDPGQLAAPVLDAIAGFEERAITPEEFKKQLLDFSNRNEERTKAINSMVTSELERMAGALGAADGASPLLDSDSASAMLDELADKITSSIREDALGGATEKIISEIRSMAAKMDEESSGAADAIIDTLSEAFQSQHKALDDIRESIGDGGDDAAAAAIDELKSSTAAIDSKLDAITKNAEKWRERLSADLDDRQEAIENSIRNLVESRITQRMELDTQHSSEISESLSRIEKAVTEASGAAAQKEDLSHLGQAMAELRRQFDEYAAGAEDGGDETAEFRELLNGIKTEIIEAVGAAADSGLKEENLSVIRQWIEEFAPPQPLEDPDSAKASQIENLRSELTGLIGSLAPADDGNIAAELQQVRQALAEVRAAVENAAPDAPDFETLLADSRQEIIGRIELYLDNFIRKDDLESIKQRVDEIAAQPATAAPESLFDTWAGQLETLKDDLLVKLLDLENESVKKQDLELIRNWIENSGTEEKELEGKDSHEAAAALENKLDEFSRRLESVAESMLKPGDLANVRDWIKETAEAVGSAGAAQTSEAEEGTAPALSPDRIERMKQELLDELHSLGNAVLKPGDLAVVRQWLDEMGAAGPADAGAAQQVTAAADDADDTMLRAVEQWKTEVLEAVRKSASASAGAEDIAGLRDSIGSLAQQLADGAGGGSDTEAASGDGLDEALVEELNNAVDVLKTLALDNREQMETLSGGVEKKIEEMNASIGETIREILGGTAGAPGESAGAGDEHAGEAAAQIPDAQIESIAAQLAGRVSETIAGLHDSAVAAAISTPQLDPSEIAAMTAERIQSALAEADGVGAEDLEKIKTELAAKIDEAAASINGKTESIADGVRTAATESMEGFSGMAEGIREFLAKASQFADGVSTDDITQLNERLTEQLDNLGREINRASGEKLDSMNLFTSEHAEKLLEDIEAGIGRIPPPDMEAAKGMVGDLAARLDAARDRIIEEVGAKAENVTRSNEEKLDELRGAIERILQDAGGDPAETLAQLRQLIGEKITELQDTLSDDIDKKMSEKLSDQAWAIKRSNENMEKTLQQMRESVRETLDTALDELASMKDIDRLRERIEARVGDVVDGYVDRIEENLDKRDREMEKGFKAILKNMEKLLSKGIRTDLESMFSGGGILSGIFGGQKPENPLKIASRASGRGAGVGPSRSQLEDTHIKRLAYLIGKRLKKDVTDPEGSILASEGDVVDETMIRRIRDKQCTLQLIRNVDFSG